MKRLAAVVVWMGLLELWVVGSSYGASWKDDVVRKITDVYQPTSRSMSLKSGVNFENVKAGGTVMVLAQSGVTASLSTDMNYLSTGVLDGKISTEGTKIKSTGRTFEKADRVYILDVRIVGGQNGYDILRIPILSTAVSQRLEDGDTVERRYKGALDFYFPANYLATADVAEIKKAINTTLLAETEFDGAESSTTDSPATLQLGMTRGDVEKLLGAPQTVVELAGKLMYVYPQLKVTFVDDKVTDVQ